MDKLEQAREALIERILDEKVKGYPRYEYVAQNAKVEQERATRFARSCARQAAFAALSLPVEGVKGELCEHDWFDCSNEVVLPPAKSCRKCGWTVGHDESHGMFVQWPWLSALANPEAEPRLRERVECSIEFPCVKLTRMAQAHSDAFKRARAAEARLAQAERVPAVTEAMVETACKGFEAGPGLMEVSRTAMRRALEAALHPQSAAGEEGKP